MVRYSYLPYVDSRTCFDVTSESLRHYYIETELQKKDFISKLVSLYSKKMPTDTLRATLCIRDMLQRSGKVADVTKHIGSIVFAEYHKLGSENFYNKMINRLLEENRHIVTSIDMAFAFSKDYSNKTDLCLLIYRMHEKQNKKTGLIYIR